MPEVPPVSRTASLAAAAARAFQEDDGPIARAVAGFEPADILLGIIAVLEQIAAGTPRVDNTYGRAVAAAIPGARLVEIEGMGHDLPRRVWPQLLDEIVALSARAGTLQPS